MKKPSLSCKNRKSIINRICLILLCMLIVIPMTSCGKSDETSNSEEVIDSLEDLEGKRIGALVGSTIMDDAGELAGDTGEVLGFNSIIDLPQALESDKIDAFVIDGAFSLKALKENSNFEKLGESLHQIQYGFIFSKTSSESETLRIQMNEFLAEIREDGTLDELWDKWTDPEDSGKVIDYSGITGVNGIITVATSSSTGEPGEYIKDGELAGIDIELVVRFCTEYGYEPEFTDMDFTGIIAGITTDKYLMGASSITITKERAQSLNFSDPYFDGGVDVIIKTGDASESTGFLESVSNGLKRTLIEESRWKLFVKGAVNTLLISICSLICGTLLGFVVFVICRNGGRIRNRITDACIWLISGMPSVVLLMILFYVAFSSISIGGVFVSVIAFTLIFGAGTVGMLRTGLEAIDVGQKEAGIALGYTDFQTFIKVILPQIIRLQLATYQSEAKELLKGTSIVGYIAVWDLTKMGDTVRSATYDAIFPLLIVALVYFVLEYLLKKAIKAVNNVLYENNHKNVKLIKGLKFTDSEGREIAEDVSSLTLDVIRKSFKEPDAKLHKHLQFGENTDESVMQASKKSGEVFERRSETEFGSGSEKHSEEGYTEKTGEVPEERTEIIRFEHLCKTYDGLEVLKDVNLTIYKGDVVSVIGPSGCGKSTLLRCLNFLDPPTSGTIIADGMDITQKGFDTAKIHAHIGTVFQRWNLFDHWTVIENLMRPQMDLLKASRQEAYNNSMRALVIFSLQDKVLSYPHELSGGQQQRIAILRTLLLQPSIIVLDEPTSALDPCMVGEVQMVLSYYAKAGTTMLIVSHDMNFSRNICNRVVFMDDKHVYEEGTPEEIFDHPKLPRTITFINRARYQYFDINDRKIDILDIISRIDGFCIENRIPVNVNKRLKEAFIGVVLEIIIPNLDKEFKLRVILSYLDKLDQTKLVLFYTGELFDPESCGQSEYWTDAVVDFESYEHHSHEENGYTNWFSAVIRKD